MTDPTGGWSLAMHVAAAPPEVRQACELAQRLVTATPERRRNALRHFPPEFRRGLVAEIDEVLAVNPTVQDALLDVTVRTLGERWGGARWVRELHARLTKRPEEEP